MPSVAHARIEHLEGPVLFKKLNKTSNEIERYELKEKYQTIKK